jgi:hypothetical protein
MGEGPIDLPDPLEQPHLDEESADELLAQMAGAEIDRLLRENDIERIPAVLVHSPAEPPTPRPRPAKHSQAGARDPLAAGVAVDPSDESIDPPLTIADIDEQSAKAAEAVIAEHGAEPGAVAQASAEAAATATTAHAIDAELARQLDDVFAQITNPETALPPVPANQGTSPLPQAHAAATTDKAVDLLEQIGLLEKQILNTEILQTTQQLLAEPIHKPVPSDEDAPPKLPLYLRPLEWLNLPLAFFPNDARDAVGKVAIVTLVNALAILLYVLIFR